jgi:hypothetical protein
MSHAEDAHIAKNPAGRKQMSNTNFSEDQDGKWIIGLSLAALVVVGGYLLTTSNSQKINVAPAQQSAAIK